MNTSSKKWELKSNGSIERVGPFGSYGPVVHAANKSEATTKLLAFAYRSLEQTPIVKAKNGAWQLAYVALEGLNVEAGIDGRDCSLCLSHVDSRSELNDNTASFDYYSSDAYRGHGERHSCAAKL